MDYRVLKILNESALLLVTPNGRKHNTNINDVKPCTTLDLTENVWNSFLNSIKTIKTMIIPYDTVTNFNTYNRNSTTTTCPPNHIKCQHQSSEVKQYYLYTHKFNTYHIQMQCQYFICSSHIPFEWWHHLPQQMLLRPTVTNVKLGQE